ncbi:ATP-binding protein [Streptomyces liliifuscus]|uniref:ATP-binding protein n=1 Tax=Streptomyces liliifuscus TaxID=2797636 RepID=A0A7T7I4Z9_9ACTN|nr:ATP-binding protein [Streptomyces liliifuscus]QQM41116.1 ATP-binding protein [Streptomyces liliifuscus]
MEDVLRGPTPPPGVPVPFVGRDSEVEALSGRLNRWSEPGTSEENPKVVVLHGPAGVGKSALAAALVERLGLRHVHWLSLSDLARAEPTLLRLLAEHGAPRWPVVEAALTADRTGDQREFARELRDQCREHIQGSALVLDGVHPTLGRELLEVLHQGTNLVIITSRQKARWGDLGAYLHTVRPLGARDSVQLAQGVAATRWAGFSPSPEHRRLVSAARGLPLWARVAGAVLAGLEGATPLPVKGPGELLTLATDLLDPAVADMLLRLAAQEEGSAPFSALTVEALLPEDTDPSDVPHILSSLRSYELLLEPSDGRLVLPSPVATAALLRMPQIDRDLLTARVQADVEEAVTHSALGVARLLDGREVPGGRWETRFTPAELVEHVDEFMTLLDRHRYLSGNRHELADALATLLAVRGDAHRLVALHRASGDLTRRGLSLLLRTLGMSQTLRSGQVEESPQRAALGEADASYHAGELSRALTTLDSAPEALGADSAWLSTIRGAALCDQGRPLAAESELAEAEEICRLISFVRGRGWALLHHARACLLMSRAQKADHLLGQATQALRTAGDIRGLNWTATERIRLLLLSGPAEAALVAAQKTLTAHEQAEDIRGMGWTCHLLALGHARLGHSADARVALLASADHFRTCDDQLGAAWTRHRLAILTPDHWQVPELRSTAAEFTELGCDLGQAWSLLECALRAGPSPNEPNELAQAETLFTGLNDQGGLAWAQAVRARRLLPDEVASLVDLAWNHPQDIHNREQLDEDIRTFWRASEAETRPVIPLHARDTVAVSDPRRHKALAKYLATGATPPAAPRCHTRLTLLDDSPTTHATARILLRVTPETSHPWASSQDDRPWLTVVAVPLTAASVEPPTALLRPSPREVHGTEFALTAHRPGIHVIRFTIALEHTGTVLQQVETELEILDTGHPAGLAAPHATSLRGR